MKKKAVLKSVETKSGEALPGPDPKPKAGDTINYEVSDSHGSKLAGKIIPGTVKFVHPGHDGRLIDLEVETEAGPYRFGPVPFREADGEPNGNTWHWPDEPEPEDPPNNKTKDPKSEKTQDEESKEGGPKDPPKS